MKKGVCATCNREMTLQAKGLCCTCYAKQRKAVNGPDEKWVKAKKKALREYINNNSDVAANGNEDIGAEVEALESAVGKINGKYQEMAENNKRLRLELVSAVGKIREMRDRLNENYCGVKAEEEA